MGNFPGLPPDLSAHGPQIDQIIGLVHLLMFVLFIGWGTFFIYLLVRFRKGRQPKAEYAGVKGHTSTYLEIGIAVFEAVLLIGFAVPLWSARVNDFPSEQDATVVRIVAEQFAWNVHYPGPDGVFGRTDPALITSDNPLGLDRSDSAAKDDITTINQLNLPVGKPVIIHLSSKDVIHSFNLPLFRVKQDVIPGQSIPVWFIPTGTTADLKAKLTRTYPIAKGQIPPELAHLVAMADYRGKAGDTVVTQGTPLTDDVVGQLLDAGVSEVLAGPDTPTEIACAQLCGLGHYRMRGFVTIQTADEFKAWVADQEAALSQ